MLLDPFRQDRMLLDPFHLVGRLLFTVENMEIRSDIGGSDALSD